MLHYEWFAFVHIELKRRGVEMKEAKSDTALQKRHIQHWLWSLPVRSIICDIKWSKHQVLCNNRGPAFSRPSLG